MKKRVALIRQPEYNAGMKKCLLWLVLFLAVTPALARTRSHHHRPHPPLLFPTAGSLARQNAVANGMSLPRVKDRAQLRQLVEDGSLVPLPTSIALKSTVPQFRAFLHPAAAGLLADISVQFYEIWNRPITVDSAVRPIDVQRRLWRSHRVPAAPPTGPLASVHPAGLAFDIGKRTLTAQQRRWLEFRLFYLQAIGRAIVEEERACFHVVYSPGLALPDAENEPNVTLPWYTEAYGKAFIQEAASY